jgi:hypothetical protein
MRNSQKTIIDGKNVAIKALYQENENFLKKSCPQIWISYFDHIVLTYRKSNKNNFHFLPIF